MSSQASGYGKENPPPGRDSHRLKCTYKDCFRYFSNEKDMIMHKKKEPSHEYCHKCDVDCEDDSDLLIHMIESGKHIVCPMCGVEFKSNAGLESHIPQAHQQSQNLKCVGCGDKFARAAGLMEHIENNECQVITQEMFERRRAEKAICKDAWAAHLKPGVEQQVPRGHMSTFSGTDASTEHGGVSLLDEDNPYESNIHSSRQDYLTPSLEMLSLRDQYPTLQNLNAPIQKTVLDQEEGSGLMSVKGDLPNENEVHVTPAWSASPPAASTLFQNSKPPLRPTKENSDISGGLAAPRLALSTDPNAHLSTKPGPMKPAAILEPTNHYNALTKKFECPGRKCGGSFDTVEAFNAHLTSSAHVGGRTVCPSCLNKFTSTMALVAHCESPSKRCNIRNTANYNQVLREITGGLIGTEGHHIDGSVRYVANDISQPGYW
ncbi:hypothetical protein GJ744_012117 [Endocarpon pusillum]|uniref:C2H2-type domain-containing protein n=1 Tax=Endocarpon pusillum TaxID=364733 RepID=A0A8H7AJE3_9EURO|nr:hypothetical protein GJ744_012117 [Endocarpon pusillum]